MIIELIKENEKVKLENQIFKNRIHSIITLDIPNQTNYMKKEKWIAAINRFKQVVELYDSTAYVEEALHRLVELHYRLGLLDESKKYAKLNPTFIAIEPPELIGTGRAISTERPQLITKAVDSVKSAKNSTKLLCGAGIVSGNDVARAKQLGSKGILVASGIVKAKNWEKIIEEFSRALV